MRHADICRWLAHFPGSSPAKTQTPKRKLDSVTTPPPSHDDDSQSRKRQRLGHDASADIDVDVDATPRPAARASVLRDAISISSSISQTSSKQSSPCASGSQKSSPRKKMASLAIPSDGIAVRLIQRSTSGLPEELVKLFKKFRAMPSGSGILPETLKEALVAEAEKDPTLPLTEANFRKPTAADASYPPLDGLLGVVDWAAKCKRKGASEATWNMHVHCPLLQLAVHGGSRPLDGLVGFEACTTVDILKEYLPKGTPGKRVDFVLHIEPPSDVEEALDILRETLPATSINHTGAEPLLGYPITASFETKRHGAGTGDAELQIGTWHAAQWKLLQDLLDRNAVVAHVPVVANKPALLPFLPGVIINGHDWALVATTRSGMKTFLWTEIPFGSTRDIIGVAQIVQGIRELVVWSETVYWPWFREHVLPS